MFNEAQLRGIDLDKLQEESFSSREHLKMMAHHEIFAREYWRIMKETARPEASKTTKKVKSVKPVAKVRQSKKYLFTPEQVNIANAIFRNEKNK
jgi:hypothetical protein